MLARYRIVRGVRDPKDPLPEGMRIDTRKHTRHVLRPDPESVRALQADHTKVRFRVFAEGYLALLEARFETDRESFDALADHARAGDVYIGCSCPSEANPDVSRCHTVLALGFMKKRYPDLDVRLP